MKINLDAYLCTFMLRALLCSREIASSFSCFSLIDRISLIMSPVESPWPNDLITHFRNHLLPRWPSSGAPGHRFNSIPDTPTARPPPRGGTIIEWIRPSSVLVTRFRRISARINPVPSRFPGVRKMVNVRGKRNLLRLGCRFGLYEDGLFRWNLNISKWPAYRYHIDTNRGPMMLFNII